MKHVDSVLKGIKIVCEKCNKTLSSYSALKHHKSAHEKRKCYPRNEWGKTFERKDNFQKHVSTFVEKNLKNNKSSLIFFWSKNKSKGDIFSTCFSIFNLMLSLRLKQKVNYQNFTISNVKHAT